MRDFPFSEGNEHILPAEALLASIEVKSRLTGDEVRKSSEAAQKAACVETVQGSACRT
jgi:hypothetical protein